jgi:hypothetical protein
VLHYTGYYVPIENVWQDSEGVKLEDDGVQWICSFIIQGLHAPIHKNNR